MMVENDHLILSDRRRQIFSDIEKKSTEKLSIPLSNLSSRKIEVYGGDGEHNLLIHYSEANVERYLRNGLWHLMSAPVESIEAGQFVNI